MREFASVVCLLRVKLAVGRPGAAAFCLSVSLSLSFCLSQDLAAVDPAVLRSLEWLLTHDLGDQASVTTATGTGADLTHRGDDGGGGGGGGDDDDGGSGGGPLELYFVVESSAFGARAVHELVPGGAQRRVTNDNKAEFAECKAQWLLRGCKAAQLAALRQGFITVMPEPERLLGAFDAAELELLLCGVPTLELSEWRAHTDYRAGYHSAHPAVRRLWRVVGGMDQPTRAKLLRFVTGTSALPPGGCVPTCRAAAAT